jgi:hypothetical protein
MKDNRNLMRRIVWILCCVAMIGCIVDLAFYDFMKMDEIYNILLFIVLGLFLGYAGMEMRRRYVL